MNVTKPATADYAVTIVSSPRTFPRRSTDYTVAVIDRSGNRLAHSTTSSQKSACALANAAWVALREGVAPASVWNR